MIVKIRPAREVDLPGVAAVLQDAFSDKMRIIFGDQPAKVRTLLEAVYIGPVRRGYDGVLIAEHAGRVVGTLLIEPMDHTPAESRVYENIAVREFGVPRMLLASFLLWLVGYRPARNEAYISDVAVASDCQGESVGQQLMTYAEQWARDQQRARLTLWVAASNEPAIHLYQKSGLVISETRSSWLTRLAYGIQEWHFMEKALTPSEPSSLITRT
ncbi:MAG: GNAT family N-acetyltransferase [Anaerolineae bacterium]|nr:GNAT family N-acetyltransferase [Anaerolineae bacterium]